LTGSDRDFDFHIVAANGFLLVALLLPITRKVWRAIMTQDWRIA